MNRRRRPNTLTPREWEVLLLLREGLSNEHIAVRLGISFDGAKYHVGEIISRLGVRTRQEAAAWRPTADDDAPARAGAFAPLAGLRRIRLSSLATPAGIAAIAVVAVAVAALTWGVVATRGSASDGSAWSYDDSASTGASVMVFDLATRAASRLPVSDNVSVARWLKQGETFVAHGEAVDDYPIYGLDGKKILTPLTQGDLTSEVVPAPDGSAVIVGRTDQQYLVSEIPTGFGSTFLTSARDLSFAPEGRMAWVTVGGSDQDNVVHDFRTVFVTQHSTLTGYVGGGMAIRSQREADGVIDLAPDPWSSDSKYLLTLGWPACGAPTCQGPPVYEVYGTDLSFKVVWKQYAGELLSAQWAGPLRLYVVFRPGLTRDPDYPDAPALLVDLAGNKTLMPDVLTGALITSFSPAGNYVVARTDDGPGSDGRCGLFEVATGREIAGFDAGPSDRNRGFCAFANWTGDGSKVVVSAGGGT